MARFFTSDTHFGHRNILKYCPDRPYRDVDHMNEMIIQTWNSVVNWDDEVYHLGDVALGPWDKWDNLLTRLSGDKFLVIGNHDRVFAGEKERQRERFGEHYAKWFNIGMSDHVTALPFETSKGTVLVNLSHFPYDGDSHGEDRYSEFRLEDKGRPLIHGHTHISTQRATVSSKGTPQFHVGWDAWLQPVPESAIITWLESL